MKGSGGIATGSGRGRDHRPHKVGRPVSEVLEDPLSGPTDADERADPALDVGIEGAALREVERQSESHLAPGELTTGKDTARAGRAIGQRQRSHGADEFGVVGGEKDRFLSPAEPRPERGESCLEPVDVNDIRLRFGGDLVQPSAEATSPGVSAIAWRAGDRGTRNVRTSRMRSGTGSVTIAAMTLR